MYDGELLVSLKSVPPDHWLEHEEERLALKSVAELALGHEEITSDVRNDVQEMLNGLARLP